MRHAVVGLTIGAAFGFILAWARVTDPAVIRNMLLLREPDIFLLMGSAMAVAAIGVRLMRAAGARALLTGEPIAWTPIRPAARHIWGSALFGAGWSVAATCPGPLAAMIGEGRLGGLTVVAGLAIGILLRDLVAHPRSAPTHTETAPGL